MIAIIKQAPSFLCNDNCDSNRVSCDYPKHAQKAPFSCLQNPDGIVTPPLQLKAVVTQRGASWGDISEGEKSDKPAVQKSVRKTGKHRRRHSAFR